VKGSKTLLTTSGYRLGSVMLAGLGSRERPGYLQTRQCGSAGYDSGIHAAGGEGHGFECGALSMLEDVGDVD